jgi:hypothetical protein
MCLKQHAFSSARLALLPWSFPRRVRKKKEVKTNNNFLNGWFPEEE